VDALRLGRRIALVKIDAEAHEAAVLRGMPDLLAAHHPALIVETKDAAVVASLAALGYRSERLPGPPNLLFKAEG
jgi:hypothetical protein